MVIGFYVFFESTVKEDLKTNLQKNVMDATLVEALERL
jgi:hypothetical protein